MIFHRLTLQDVGLFAGEHTFELMPRVKYGRTRPIVLMGGKNGAGKTTILDTIRLCLYGPRVLGVRVSKAEYQQYLADLIHHSPALLIQPSSAGITLEFEHIHSGHRERYTVDRHWENTGKSIDEALTISRNGEPVKDLDADQWQDFLDELIPFRLSQLFFFDGEKIQRLAEDTADEGVLAESVKSLLGLDLVERLQSDLTIYVRRTTRNNKETASTLHLSEIEQTVEQLEEQLQQARQDRAGTESQIAHIYGRIERQEARISSEGGGFARQREELKERQGKLQAEIAQIENQLRELAAGPLPFAFVPSLCRALRERLLHEEERTRWESARQWFETGAQSIQKTLQSDMFWTSFEGIDMPVRKRKTLGKKIISLLEDHAQMPEDIQGIEPIHNLSVTDSQQLIAWIDAVLKQIPGKMHKLTQQLEKCHRDLQDTETALRQAPPDEVLQPLMTEMNRLNQDLGQHRKQAEEEDKSIKSLEFRLEEAERKKKRLEEECLKQETSIDRLHMVDGIQTVLNEYTDRLTSSKIENLKHTVAACFNQLCRKGDVVKEIDVNPETFAVTLYDQNHRPISKDRLSAGEKQIYAISMLWGLAKTSGRPLPMIIDTPLGRLDSDHRKHLVAHYFPEVSHQVIILSTDTELDQMYFDMLMPHISHGYALEFDRRDYATSVTEGYFFKMMEEDIQHAD